MSSTYLKIVIVGDGACGKTCMLISYKEGTFLQEHIPTIFENYSKNYVLSLWDTAGQEAYERLRPLSYSGADLVIICYSVNCIDSLKNVPQYWIPEDDAIARHKQAILSRSSHDTQFCVFCKYEFVQDDSKCHCRFSPS
ncbi:GTP-binding protein RHO4-like [Octopus sinensis]|uniref:GTP-binding protein RHO4-like n=1 Tax=Octopus sinensis TaxID=2607531 RepID=A0A6P7TZU8_9MOLL|nr:GTP-binding protein RHO4-like [Octopus sinensis]